MCFQPVVLHGFPTCRRLAHAPLLCGFCPGPVPDKKTTIAKTSDHNSFPANDLCSGRGPRARQTVHARVRTDVDSKFASHSLARAYVVDRSCAEFVNRLRPHGYFLSVVERSTISVGPPNPEIGGPALATMPTTLRVVPVGARELVPPGLRKIEAAMAR
jgi:hypothetical protein